MARYQRLGDIYNTQRLGSFEAYTGANLGSAWDSLGPPELQLDAPEPADIGPSVLDDPAALRSVVLDEPQDSGVSAGEVLTGIASFITPLANLGVNIYRHERGVPAPAVPAAGGAVARPTGPTPPSGGNTTIIIAVVAVLVVMMMMMMFMMQKK